jgi:hypothetical protein
VEIISDIKRSMGELDVGPKPLRNFGILFFVVFFVLVGLIAYKYWGQWSILAGHPWAWGFAVAGLVFLGLGFLWPRALTHPYRLWMAFALVLGAVVNALILSVVFYLLLTPIGLVMRLFGRDPMHRKFDRRATSYWTERPTDSNEPKRIEKMF